MTIYSEDRYQELLKNRESQAAELRSLNEKLKGDLSIKPGNPNPEEKQRNEDVMRQGWLSSIASTDKTKFGQVRSIGSDYIAVLPLSEAIELFMPQWSIFAIRRDRSTSK